MSFAARLPSDICSRLTRIARTAYYPYVMPNSPSSDFAEVIRQIRALKTRNEIEIDEIPAPQKLAPFSLALSAQVSDEKATGRFVLLRDPAGQEGWSGNYRCVTFVRADIETDMVSDPLLGDLGWAWLMEIPK